jgi:hypothetical protein
MGNEQYLYNINGSRHRRKSDEESVYPALPGVWRRRKALRHRAGRSARREGDHNVESGSIIVYYSERRSAALTRRLDVDAYINIRHRGMTRQASAVLACAAK